MKRFVVVGNPDSNRIAFWQRALARLDLPPAILVSWADLLAGRASLTDAVTPGAIVRIESPGKDFGVERALLEWGADIPDEESKFDGLSRRECAALAFDKGQILCPRQWYLGFRAALRMVSAQLAACPAHTVLNAPSDIEAMFDKPRCHEMLLEAGLPVPPDLGPVRSYNELTARMEEMGCRRVFVKLAHGSSASGVVAYQIDGRGRHQAVTTTEMITVDSELRLFNSRRLTTYRDHAEIARLIDALCRHRVHVEHWLPKAGIDDHAFDLRVVVIGGQARHVVPRLSRSPITNLHLLNQRGDPAAIRERMGEANWTAAMTACERALRCFPNSLYAGIDLLIAPDFRHHAILEVNAFGDLLLGILYGGVDTYEAEIQAAQSGRVKRA